MNNEALIRVMMTNFQRHELERVLDIKQTVDAGSPLAEYDIAFMGQLCQEAIDSMRLVGEFPEYQNVFVQAVQLFKEITEKGLANEAR